MATPPLLARWTVMNTRTERFMGILLTRSRCFLAGESDRVVCGGGPALRRGGGRSLGAKLSSSRCRAKARRGRRLACPPRGGRPGGRREKGARPRTAPPRPHRSIRSPIGRWPKDVVGTSFTETAYGLGRGEPPQKNVALFA